MTSDHHSLRGAGRKSEPAPFIPGIWQSKSGRRWYVISRCGNPEWLYSWAFDDIKWDSTNGHGYRKGPCEWYRDDDLDLTRIIYVSSDVPVYCCCEVCGKADEKDAITEGMCRDCIGVVREAMLAERQRKVGRFDVLTAVVIGCWAAVIVWSWLR